MTFSLAKYLTLLPPTPFCVYKVHFNSSVSILIKNKWILKNVVALLIKDCEAGE